MPGGSETQRPTVNIVVRTKNRPLFLRRAFADIEAQRFTDWLITLVNDGGLAADVDAEVEALDAHLADNVSVIHLEETVGRAAAANIGVRALSDTKYFVLHDDDDTWDPRFLEHTVAWLEKHDDVSAVAVPTDIIREKISGANVVEIGRERFEPNLRAISLIDLLEYNRCVPISVLYRNSAVQEVGGFDDTVELTEDWELNIRLLSVGEIGFIRGDALAFWHQRPGLTGDSANSVVALDVGHDEFDRLVRDRAIRTHIQQFGPGLPFLIGEYARRLGELEQQVHELERLIGDTPTRMLMRKARKLFGR